jgi:hypothetical protein
VTARDELTAIATEHGWKVSMEPRRDIWTRDGRECVDICYKKNGVVHHLVLRDSAGTTTYPTIYRRTAAESALTVPRKEPQPTIIPESTTQEKIVNLATEHGWDGIRNNNRQDVYRHKDLPDARVYVNYHPGGGFHEARFATISAGDRATFIDRLTVDALTELGNWLANPAWLANTAPKASPKSEPAVGDLQYELRWLCAGPTERTKRVDTLAGAQHLADALRDLDYDPTHIRIHRREIRYTAWVEVPASHLNPPKSVTQ